MDQRTVGAVYVPSFQTKALKIPPVGGIINTMIPPVGGIMVLEETSQLIRFLPAKKKERKAGQKTKYKKIILKKRKEEKKKRRKEEKKKKKRKKRKKRNRNAPESGLSA